MLFTLTGANVHDYKRTGIDVVDAFVRNIITHSEYTWVFEYEPQEWSAGPVNTVTVHTLMAKIEGIEYPEISVYAFANGYVSVRWNGIDANGCRSYRQALKTHYIAVVHAALPVIAKTLYHGMEDPEW